MTDHDFPPLLNDRILRAAKGEHTDKVPVWVMRQAGRYLPEFRELRQKHDFFTICQTPELACEVTLQPLRRFNFDASIIFSDILVIPQALGMVVEMRPGVGPVLPEPLTDPAHLDRLDEPDVDKTLGYVGKAITLTRHKLEGKVPLIGFSGAPWTLMCYMVEGGGSSTMAQARKWLYKWPKESHILLKKITRVVIDYLVMQVKSGAQMVQVFESNAGFLDAQLFREFSHPYLTQISVEVRSQLNRLNIPEVPMTIFPKGLNMDSLEALGRENNYNVIGIDWTTNPVEARRRVGTKVTLQGNMDPCALFATEEEVRKRAMDMVKTIGGGHLYIANLGHGILPDTPIPNVQAFIEGVHHEMFPLPNNAI